MTNGAGVVDAGVDARIGGASVRLAAIVALIVGAATIALAVAVAVSEFPRGLALLGCVVVAGASAWYGLLRRGIARVAGLTVAALALAGAVALVAEWPLVAQLLVVAGLLVSLAAARATLAVHAALPSTSAPRVLRVRVARRHPQASPSAMVPDGVWAGVLELARIARGGLEEPATSTPRRP